MSKTLSTPKEGAIKITTLNAEVQSCQADGGINLNASGLYSESGYFSYAREVVFTLTAGSTGSVAIVIAGTTHTTIPVTSGDVYHIRMTLFGEATRGMSTVETLDATTDTTKSVTQTTSTSLMTSMQSDHVISLTGTPILVADSTAMGAIIH